jgi:hypothetical protein
VKGEVGGKLLSALRVLGAIGSESEKILFRANAQMTQSASNVKNISPQRRRGHRKREK